MSENPRHAGHHSFMETVRSLYASGGAAFAAQVLVESAIAATKAGRITRFDTMEDLVKSMESVESPVSTFDGLARHYGDGVFGLPTCPFAASAGIDRGDEATAGASAAVTAALNEPSAQSEALRIGEGAASSPFCAMHQPVRSVIGGRVEVAGKRLEIYQLGCQTADGRTAMSPRWIKEAGVSPALVEKILEHDKCCFCLRLSDRSVGDSEQ